MKTSSAIYADQRDFFDPSTFIYPVHIIGCGGATNSLGPVLAKMGVREMHFWDNDVLEERNCPTEVAYSYGSTGQPKTTAMVSTIRYLLGDNGDKLTERAVELTSRTESNRRIVSQVEAYTVLDNGIKLYEHRRRLTAEDQLEGIVVSGVDSMASRKTIWEAVQRNLETVPLYIDGRSGGTVVQHFAVRPSDFDTVKKYETWLFDDDQAMQLPCGARNYPPVALYMAAVYAELITQFHNTGEVDFFRSYVFTNKGREEE